MTGWPNERTARAYADRYESYWPAAIAARLTPRGSIWTIGVARFRCAAWANAVWNGSHQLL